MRRTFVLIALALFMASCSSASDTSPFQIPDDALVVAGTGRCEFQSLSESFDSDGVRVIEERFTCETNLSDPRGSGTEEYPVVVTRVNTPGVGGVWTAEEATITNDEGVWRGTGEGIVDLVGVSPLAEGIRPFNYGEVRYEGEGAYEGLTMRLYIAGTNNEAAYAGWIEQND
jgi:hypothetical protein